MNGFFWLVSYPKSGNTWLRMFLNSLAAGATAPDINALGIRGHAASRTEFDRILDIESADLTDDEIASARPRFYEIEAQQAEAPLLRKVHDAWQVTPSGGPLFPPELTLGALYIVRDPRDVALSFAYHMSQPVDKAIARMSNPLAVMWNPSRTLSPQLPQHLSTWGGHVESWLDAPIQRLLLKYEDMLSEPVTTFSAAARFLGFDATPASVEAAVDAVCFERLRAAEDRDGFNERQPAQDRFFRRGVAGGWKDSLTAAQIARIEADHGAMMSQLGYL